MRICAARFAIAIRAILNYRIDQDFSEQMTKKYAVYTHICTHTQNGIPFNHRKNGTLSSVIIWINVGGII